ncbi:hypothetical protein [Methylomonas fluvii]|uniref:Uncharacterized protein n=1 Tax=Methylomonas fluvii TaxID=1854564 RepID=A0ABR9DJT5_9GAMM|nr:hypothetical protein [Methylomonas fluvii]MBD9363175.1 hypothetical protein [Methylomonas fluvii]
MASHSNAFGVSCVAIRACRWFWRRPSDRAEHQYDEQTRVKPGFDRWSCPSDKTHALDIFHQGIGIDSVGLLFFINTLAKCCEASGLPPSREYRRYATQSVVNASRGDVVDSKPLMAKRIAGAGLDVYEGVT